MKKLLFIFSIVCTLTSINVVAQNTVLTSAEGQGNETTSTSNFADVATATISATSGDQVLVLATFSCALNFNSATERVGSFKIVDSLTTVVSSSAVLQRSLGEQKSYDYGIGSVVGVFKANTTGSHTYKLQHKITQNKTLQTDGTIVAIKLTDNASNQIPAVSSQVTSPVQMTTTYTGIGTTSVLTLDEPADIFAAASISTSASSTPAAADWKLQYSDNGTTNWTDFGVPVERTISNSEKGISTLSGSIQYLLSGTYYFRIAHKSTSGTVSTDAANLVVVGLSTVDNSDSQNPVSISFPLETGTSIAGASTTSNSFVSAYTKSYTPSVNTDLCIFTQYNMTSTTQITAPQFELSVNTSPVYTTLAQTRFINAGATGSGASVGLATSLTSSTAYDVSLLHKSDGTNTLTTNNINEIMFGLTSITNPYLPIHLISFDALTKENSILLNWKTASEVNNQFFYIEKSFDNKNWRAIGKVNGAGNSNTQLNYDFIDKNPHIGISYYRLKQIDFDGTSEKFETISVNFNDNSTAINVYPNPVINEIVIESYSNTENKNFEILNSTGQIVYKGNLNGKVTVPTSNFAKGVYLVKIQRGDYFELRKIIKE